MENVNINVEERVLKRMDRMEEMLTLLLEIVEDMALTPEERQHYEEAKRLIKEGKLDGFVDVKDI